MVFTFACNSIFVVNAQVLNDTIVSDTIYVEPVDSTMEATIVFDENDTLALKNAMAQTPSFKPNPKRAVMYSAIFPGLGQIYNKKYWKLPIVYGGIMGFVYAISWNNKTYQDYNRAYLDYHYDKNIDNPAAWKGKDSWGNYVPAGENWVDYITDTGFERSLRRATDSYRRYRDLSIILAAAWYFICIADAYVDAQLFDFDITPDLSMRVEPVITPKTRYSPDLYGLNCCIKF